MTILGENPCLKNESLCNKPPSPIEQFGWGFLSKNLTRKLRMQEQKKLRMFDEQVSLKPDNYPWATDYITAMWNSHWTPNSFSFESDLLDMQTKLGSKDKEVIVKALSAIGQVEIAVKKFWQVLGQNLPHPSINDLGIVMANVEVIHNRAYVRLLEKLGMDEIFEDNLKLPVVAGRVNYLRKHSHRYYSDSKKQYIYSIILFTIFVENVSLFSQFLSVCWFAKNRNAIKDVDNQIAYSAKEELTHFLAGTKIINTLREEYPELFDADLEEKIIHESHEAFKAECKIIDWMIGDFNEDGLNQSVVKTYIKNRINDSLKGIGYKAIFDDINKEELAKTEWFDMKVLGNNMKDFFHGHPTEYSKGVQVDGDSLFD